MQRYLDAIHFLTLKYNIDVLSIQQFLTKEDNIYLANKLIGKKNINSSMLRFWEINIKCSF